MPRSSSAPSRRRGCSRNDPPTSVRHTESLLVGRSRAPCRAAGAWLRAYVRPRASDGPTPAGGWKAGRRGSPSPPRSHLSRAGARATTLPRVAGGSPGRGDRGAVEPRAGFVAHAWLEGEEDPAARQFHRADPPPGVSADLATSAAPPDLSRLELATGLLFGASPRPVRLPDAAWLLAASGARARDPSVPASSSLSGELLRWAGLVGGPRRRRCAGPSRGPAATDPGHQRHRGRSGGGRIRMAAPGHRSPRPRRLAADRAHRRARRHRSVRAASAERPTACSGHATSTFTCRFSTRLAEALCSRASAAMSCSPRRGAPAWPRCVPVPFVRSRETRFGSRWPLRPRRSVAP